MEVLLAIKGSYHVGRIDSYSIAKNSEVFWLKCDDEIVVVAPNGQHSSPRCIVERVVDLVRNY
jgi:hypothetical protein